MELKMRTIDADLGVGDCDPRLFEAELKAYCQRNGVLFRCTCCDKQLLYRFSKNLHFIPFSRAVSKGHSENCPLNKQYLERDQRNNAVHIDYETRTLHVSVIDRLWEPPGKRTPYTAPVYSKRSYDPDEQRRPHWTSILKDVNCEVSYLNAHRRQQRMPYKDYRAYTAQVYELPQPDGSGF